MSADEEDLERQEVEWVFGLCGGELNDEPWNGFAYNYDGLPDYAVRDFPDRFDHEYHTIIGCFLYGAPPERLVDESGVWRLQAVYPSSGEAECPLSDLGADEQESVYEHRQQRFGLPPLERCFLCDERRGAEHGYVYLGDGYAEIVYRLDSSDADDDESTNLL